MQIGNKGIKSPLFANHIIQCLKDTVNSSKIFRPLDKYSSKVAQYKSINQYPVAFMYTNNEFIEKEIIKDILFTHKSFKQT